MRYSIHLLISERNKLYETKEFYENCITLNKHNKVVITQIQPSLTTCVNKINDINKAVEILCSEKTEVQRR